MNHTHQVAVLKEIFRHIDAGTTPMADAPYWNPVERYTSEAHFKTELQTLFKGAMPLLAGFTPDLPTPGSWFTYDMPDAPIFVTRGPDGKARAFLNICRHRGSRLVGFEMNDEGQFIHARGSTPKVLACAYHAWTYSLEGTLIRHANDMGGFKQIEDGIACGQFNLTELPCVETGGMILVRPQGSKPIDVGPETHKMHQRMGEFGFDQFHFYQEVFGDFTANWKLLMDTFLEGYHIASLHHATLAPRFRCYPVVYETFGPHALFPLTRKSIDEQRHRPESEWSVLKHASTVFLVSPNAVLNIPMDGHMELWDFRPLETGKTRVRIRFYIPETITTEAQQTLWQKSWKISTDVIFREDFIQQQNIQANLASARLPGVVFGANEPMLAHFHRELGKLTGTADQPVPPFQK
jgi:phenylpropionate dioxygenase-like ring-hydroxylating dioxygenase large terminal subunit